MEKQERVKTTVYATPEEYEILDECVRAHYDTFLADKVLSDFAVQTDGEVYVCHMDVPQLQCACKALEMADSLFTSHRLRVAQQMAIGYLHVAERLAQFEARLPATRSMTASERYEKIAALENLEQYAIPEAFEPKIPADALRILEENYRTHVPTAVCKHPQWGLYIIETTGQGPVLIWPSPLKADRYDIDLAYGDTDNDFLYFILFDPETPYVVSNQVGGTQCAHPRLHGVIVPLCKDFLPKTETLSWMEKYDPAKVDAWLKATSSERVRSGKDLALDSVFEAIPDIDNSGFPDDDARQMGEAWIPVRVKADLPLIELDTIEILHGMEGCVGVLTYPSSD